MPTMQLAYRQFHSTETAVLKTYNDLLLAADNRDVFALCLLDLTAAFDTVDHDHDHPQQPSIRCAWPDGLELFA